MISDPKRHAESVLRSALRRMAAKYPYHAEWLSSDRWQEESGVGTMAVTVRSGRVRFHYNAVFVSDCTSAEVEAVIHHELNHLVFRHPMVDPKKYPNRHARLIAEEVTVNEHVPEPLPGNPVTLDDFPDLPSGEDTDTRYHRLADRTDLTDKVRLLDLHSLWSEQPFDNEAWASDLVSVHRAMSNEVRGGGGGSGDLLEWAMNYPWGLRAGPAVVESLRSATRPTKPLDWTRILTSVNGVRVRREAAFHRPPRRLPHLIGVFPGCTCRTDKPRVMVAIDTSGSMRRAQFERVKAELARICKVADVTVVQCDKAITKIHPLKGVLQEITGRGGTDLRPPFAQAVIKKVRPAVIIYFTDGRGPTPNSAPNVPVIWCLTPSSKRPTHWGRVVHMKA